MIKLTKTQRRNARKRRAAGRLTHVRIEISCEMKSGHCTIADQMWGNLPHYGHYGDCWECQEFEEQDFHERHDSCLFNECGLEYFYVDIIDTTIQQAGLSEEIVSRIRASVQKALQYEFTRLLCDISYDGADDEEETLVWPVEVDAEAVVADVIAAISLP